MRKPGSVDQYIERIKPVVRKTRFSQLKIDEVAKVMDISKATLYKYFSSGEDIISTIVDHYTDYMLQADTLVQEDSVPYPERFQRLYGHSLRCVIYGSNLFMQDLQENYPPLYDKLAAAQQVRNKNLTPFYESGMEKKIFNPMNPILFMIQDEAVLRSIVEPLFCVQYDLTLKQALLDFYTLKKFQLLTPEHLQAVDDSIIENEIVQLLQSL
ncbi:TetR family transcriptional regulator [Paenibacillus mucilaginosus 3016]|uniref:TetR family transcriptional regulator n=2 Tax=Paenibacillus mucilaginosus TaxID=61624 RepID=H6NPF3_9BACL|nr:TetR/AcrR family transcriptional regulator [Paenibacillus mucilaginosus]AFC32565.1 TetR family transcriptional regulator [Paenibacillus mucilaginosus 3016]AFH64887.1 TetR family transcriptional regulator [Paenibacillus mucilaginosus K02]WFA21041.1 TetR/AcrR family transcriptional regulator [Paenibacillus mucilaginosus]